jgi:hypothetical protein
MNSDSYLFIALPLIGMAGSLALLAYAISVGRRKEEKTAEDDDDQAAPEEPVELTDDQPAQEEPVEVADDQPAQDDAIMVEEKPVEDSPIREDTVATPLDDDVFTAELFRNRKTGSLIVKIGEQRYSKAAEIKDLETLGRLEDTGEALTQWLAIADIVVLSPEDIAIEKARKAAVKQKTMIDEINEILDQKAEEGEAPLGLRLFEGPEGTVRVYVGVNSYEVDEVPDKKIQGVIKSAVAEWEALQ